MLTLAPAIEAMFTTRPPPLAIMERTTYFVRTMGERGVQAHELLDLRRGHEREHAFETHRRVVYQPINGADALPHRLDQRRNLSDPGEVEGEEMERSGIGAVGFPHRRFQFIGLFPCDGEEIRTGRVRGTGDKSK